MNELDVLISEGVIDEVLGRLKSGKEADISLVRRGDVVIAAKVYKDRATRSFKNNADYKEGRKVRNSRTQRAIDSGGRFGRDSAEQAWKSAEVDAMYKLVGTGVRVPEPLMFYEGVLLMTLVRDAEGRPAPRLIDVTIERDAAIGVYADLVAQMISMLCCDLIHGDLSPYNILAAADGPTIIDFPQVISAAHSTRAEYFFLRDFDNVVSFLAGFDPSLAVHKADGRAIWRAYVSRELTPQFVPPPPPPPGASRGRDQRSDGRGRDRRFGGRPQQSGGGRAPQQQGRDGRPPFGDGQQSGVGRAPQQPREFRPQQSRDGRPPSRDGGPQQPRDGRPFHDRGPQQSRNGGAPQQSRDGRPPSGDGGPQQPRDGRPFHDRGPQQSRDGGAPQSRDGGAPQQSRDGRPPARDGGPRDGGALQPARDRPPSRDGGPRDGRPPARDGRAPQRTDNRPQRSSAGPPRGNPPPRPNPPPRRPPPVIAVRWSEDGPRAVQGGGRRRPKRRS